MIKAGLEDGRDGGIADCVDGQGPLTSRFHADALVTPDKGQNAEGRTKALFRVGAVAHHTLDHQSCICTDTRGPGSEDWPELH